MKFSTQQDVNAPIEAVFEMLTEFDTYEKAATRRGADVARVSVGAEGGFGAAWHVRFPLRGKERDARLEVTRCQAPGDFEVSLQSRNVTGELVCRLTALSPSKTRLAVAFEVRPITLPGRVLIQSLKLAKARTSAKFKARIAEVASDMEMRHTRRA
jgi:hypothetical protein